MNVQELEDYLARLPKELLVVVGGFHVGHIKVVARKTASVNRCDFPLGIYEPGDRIPPHLLLGTGYSLWFDEEPMHIEVKGRWSKEKPPTDLRMLRPGYPGLKPYLLLNRVTGIGQEVAQPAVVGHAAKHV